MRVKLLAFNDFHGQLAPKTVDGRPAGGAAVLASYLKAAARGFEDRVFLLHAGDFVGASPPSSALLQDEPSVSFLNLLAGTHCAPERPASTSCNVIGTLGNHEFDRGKDELLRRLRGGNHVAGPFLENPWRGARYDTVSSNVVEDATGKTLFSPYALRRVDGIPIAFIGATLRETPTIVLPTGVRGLTFVDEAEAVNREVTELRARGVHAFVVQIHQGDEQPSYAGPTDAKAPPPAGALDAIVAELDDDVDVVVSGHTHRFTNAFVANKHGKRMLVTQALSAGTAYADIDLTLDPATGDVATLTASIVPTWADAGPGLRPDPVVARLVKSAEERVLPLVSRVINEARATISRAPTGAGESALGDLVAESQRVAAGSDFAVMNPGGIRADLDAGPVTWGELFTVEPFGNSVVSVTLTGDDLYTLLNEQWGPGQPEGGRVLQIAGFGYTWDAAVPPGGARVVEVHDAAGRALDRRASYRVAANSFLTAGGDGFTVLEKGTNPVGGPNDLDALVAYVTGLPRPFAATTDGRIQRR